MIKKKIKIELYGGNFEFFYCKKHEFSHYVMKNYGLEISDDVKSSNGICLNLVNDEGHNLNVLFIDNKIKDKTELISIIGHEVSHLCFYLADYYGIEVAPGNNNEPYCYLFSNIFEKCLKAIVVKKKK